MKGQEGMASMGQLGDVDRYITLTLNQAEFDMLTVVRLKVQADLTKELTWAEFVCYLAKKEVD